jgi:hypothetical protein
MENTIKSFENFLNEYYISEAPGSVVVPGEWYKDNVNSRNYRPAYTQMPQVVDSMFQTTDLYNYLDTLQEEEEFKKMIESKDGADKIVKYLKKRIHEELSHKAKTSTQ